MEGGPTGVLEQCEEPVSFVMSEHSGSKGGPNTGNMLRGPKFAQERHYGYGFTGQNILAV